MMVSGPGRAFASWTAARRVHWRPALAQIPSPGEASTASIVLVTLNVAARTRVAVTNRHTGPSRRCSGVLTSPLSKMLRIILVMTYKEALRIPPVDTSCALGAPSGTRTRSRAFARFARGADVQACNAEQHRATSGCAFPLTHAPLRRYRLRAARLDARPSNVPRPAGPPPSA